MVEQPSDVIPIERSGEFHGRYHVLGGALSPIDGVDPEDLHIGELLGRVTNGAGVSEVVIATNATTTGEATALYLADALRQRAPCWRSRGWPAGCRSAPTSSTRTRSRSAGRCAAARRCSRAQAGCESARMALASCAAPARTTARTPARCT